MERDNKDGSKDLPANVKKLLLSLFEQPVQDVKKEHKFWSTQPVPQNGNVYPI